MFSVVKWVFNKKNYSGDINQLPDDILLATFELCVKDALEIFVNAPLNAKPPFVPPFFSISQVCRTWRSLYYSFPSLSQVIEIPAYPQWTRREAERVQHALRLCSNKMEDQIRLRQGRIILDITDTGNAARVDAKFPPGIDASEEVDVYLLLRDVDNTKPLPLHFTKRLFPLRQILRLCDEGGSIRHVTVHWPKRGQIPKSVAAAISQLSPRVLTLVNVTPYYHPTEIDGSTITTLHLDLIPTQSGMDLETVLWPNIKDLRIYSRKIDTRFSLQEYYHGPSEYITMSNITTLGITPLHDFLVAKLKLPALETVIFFPATGRLNFGNSDERQTLRLQMLLQSVRRMEFHTWSEKYTRDCTWSSIPPVLATLRPRLPYLRVVTCRWSYVYGPRLLENFRLQYSDSHGEQLLDELVFEECHGMSAGDLAEISMMVGKVRYI
ncbi:hypothetical protein PIIN_09095 [Serendipita indica DSM 11827]|uniref:F-box domain-containing protein n=1 Tax=Serendipita indica (strain DSM 11827) TaxID=1109443 RepID=G4TUW8_SERID|nr:hypothetical protein PIIN_09095 [Serendipita indica DSM 11827]